jgi:hypothetical protein
MKKSSKMSKMSKGENNKNNQKTSGPNTGNMRLQQNLAQGKKLPKVNIKY